MEVFLFTHKDIVSRLAQFIIVQSKVTPGNLGDILNDAAAWLEQNKISEPRVAIPDFICFDATAERLFDHIHDMCHNVPTIAYLNERRLQNLNDFVDLSALARNICNGVKADSQKEIKDSDEKPGSVTVHVPVEHVFAKEK